VPSRICGFCLSASFGASAANEAINHSCNVKPPSAAHFIFQHGVMNVNGTCKWFDKERGYEFLDTPDGDLFVHVSGIDFGMQLAVGDQVQFDIAPDKKSGRNKAINVRAA
jgi:cold shock protein